MKLQLEELGKVSVTCEDNHTVEKEYNALTIVNDETLGISAISKLPVPIGVPLTDKRFWMWIGAVDKQIMLDYASFKEEVINKYNELELYYKTQVEDLKRQFESLKQTSEFGVVISNSLGNDPNVVVSQKELTRIVNQLMGKVNDINGELPEGVDIIITPEYILSDGPADVNVRATCTDGKFDKISIFVDDVLTITKENIDSFEEVIQINGTSEIKVIAKLLGIEYEKVRTIHSYYPFFIGSGVDWEQVVKTENLRQYTGTLDGKYQIPIENENDRMFVIIPTSIGAQLQRITMSGFEIPCDIIRDEKYIIYKSRNRYTRGVFEIDLNIVSYELTIV